MGFSDVANEVIALAEAVHNYWSLELPKRHPNYPLINAGEDSGPPPAEEKKLRGLLESQPEDVIYKLLLLMYLGRGDFGTEDLAGHFEALKQTFNKPEWAIVQLLEKAALADYLRDGLAEFDKNGIEADHLAFAPVRSRS